MSTAWLRDLLYMGLYYKDILRYSTSWGVARLRSISDRNNSPGQANGLCKYRQTPTYTWRSLPISNRTNRAACSIYLLRILGGLASLNIVFPHRAGVAERGVQSPRNGCFPGCYEGLHHMANLVFPVVK